MLPVLSLTNTSLSASAPETPERIRQAAGEFEALLIEQMLKSARESSGGGSLDGEASAGANETMIDFANQNFARLIAQGGGLGLTRMIEKGLQRTSAAKSNEPVAASGSGPALVKETVR